jgi:hypothetical protein
VNTKVKAGALCIMLVAMFSMVLAQQTPVIVFQPENALLERGKSHKLFVRGEATDTGKLTYQWFISSTESLSNGDMITNAIDDYYVVTAVGPSSWALYFYAVVTNTVNGKSASAKSNIARVEANPMIIATMIAKNEDIISDKEATRPIVSQTTVADGKEDVCVRCERKEVTCEENIGEHTLKATDGVLGNVQPNAFSIGPNPVSKKTFGTLVFFRQGVLVKSGQLAVYSADGKIVNTIQLFSENAYNISSYREKRVVAAWDLMSNQTGRQVSDGTYLVKGMVTTVGGEKEKISLIVDVR